MSDMETRIEQAATLVLDFVQNDPQLGALMEAAICESRMERTKFDENEENTPEYRLYYAETVAFHSKLLAHAIIKLHHYI